MKKSKPTLYLIGGLGRTGKSTIARIMMRRRRVITVSTDSIRAAIRKVFTGESYIAIHKAKFRGRITFHRPGSLKLRRLTITKDLSNEDELAWQGVIGLIEGHDRKEKSLLVEGIAITPERVHRLKLKNLQLKAVFLGYNRPSHAGSILSYARKKKDWVHTVIKEHGGDDTRVRKSLEEGAKKSAVLEKQAKRFGYKYFDISARPFKTQVNAVVSYLLKQ